MSSLPLILIPAAGNSKRFLDAGITKPKGLIKFSYKGGPLINMIANVLGSYNNRSFFIGTNRHEFLDEFDERDIIQVGNTKGQADTVAKMCEILLRDQPIIIMNCDSGILYPLDVFYNQVKDFDAGLLVFDGGGNTAFSYINKFPLFDNVAEKQAISSLAVSGVYYFKSYKVLSNLIQKQLQFGISHAGEYYLSGTLGYLEGTKLAVMMQKDQLLNWGTPEDLARDPNVIVETEVASKLERYR